MLVIEDNPSPTLGKSYGISCRQLTEEERTLMTISCRDADSIRKVDGAGEVFVHAQEGVKVQRMHNGLLVEADKYCGKFHTDIVRELRGHFEPQEEIVFHELLKLIPYNAVMIELGAWWAYYSLWFKLLHPEGRRAIAIEPIPAHMEAGRRNARLNGIDLEFHTSLIGEESGMRPWKGDPKMMLTVEIKTPGQFFEENRIEKVDVLHMDIQGGELAMIHLLRPFIESGKIRYLFIATHHHLCTGDPLTHQKCLGALKGAGCRILEEFDVQESFAGDGFILACAGDTPCAWPGIKLSRNRTSTSLFRNPLYDLAELDAEVKSLRRELKANTKRVARLTQKSRGPLARAGQLLGDICSFLRE